MAILSNINGKFRVDSAGAVYFGTSAGTDGQILKSVGTGGSPVWIPQSDIVGAYLPLAGGTLTGATATASGISLTVGGALIGTTASFSGDVTISKNGAVLRITDGNITNTSFNTLVFAAPAQNKFALGVSSATGFAQNITIDGPTGSVGIGTTSPDQTGYGYKTLTIMGGATAGYAGVLELLTPTTSANGQNLGIISFGSGGTRNAMIGAVRQSGNNNGQLQFWTSAGASGIQLRTVIDAGGNVGIGTTSPSSFNSLGGKQVVIGDGTQTNNLTLYSASNSYGHVAFADSNASGSTAQYAGLIQYYHADNSMKFYTNAGIRMTINSSGTATFSDNLIVTGIVGIGTSSPGRGLTIDKSNEYASLEIIKNNTGRQIAYLGTGSSGVSDLGILQLKDNNTIAVQIYSGGTSWLNGGNVGIGVTSPASVLHIKDNSASPTQLSIQSNDFSRAEEINFLNPSTSAISGQIKYYTNPTVEYMSFSTSNNSAAVERMRIKGNGNVGIGTTSPSTNFQVKNNFFEHAVGKSHTGPGNLFSIQFGTSAQANKGSIIVTIFGSRFSPGQNDYAGGAVYYLTRANVGTISVVTASTTGTWQPIIDVNNTTKIWTFSSESPLGGSAGNFTSYSVTIQGIGHNGSTVINPTVTIL